MLRSSSLGDLRLALLAAAGLAACGGNIVVEKGAGGGSSSASGPSVAASTGSGSGAGGGYAAECAGAVAILTPLGAVSGFARCPDGTIHRRAAVTCDATEGLAACDGHEQSVMCTSDADCTAHPNGRCSHEESMGGGESDSCSCAYSCSTDADCGAGEICMCAGVAPIGENAWATCVPATCTDGSTCKSGECGLSSFSTGCGVDTELACRSPSDACRLDAQCEGSEQCVTFFGKPWACIGEACAFGRPLLIDGELRLASADHRVDWMTRDLVGSPADLGARDRETLASHWLTVAALEHASIASFARFALELLSLGAPADLIAGAQSAAMDEIEHARIAYGFASAYAGAEIGPGSLDVSGIRVRRDVREVMRSLIVEGCVGETLGAAEALALRGRVVDEAARAVYARIAVEEQRHAELAWRTLAWMLRDRSLVSFAEACFADAIREMARDPEVHGEAIPELGVLSGSELGALRRQALREVVEPCALDLCAS